MRRNLAAAVGRPVLRSVGGETIHVLSVDVEDWYQGMEIPMDRWSGYEQRVGRSMGRMLELLDRHGTNCTCFVLGKVGEDHPGLVREIHAAGHEVATHGYSHEKVYDLDPGRFREELRRSIHVLEDLTGDRVLGHRAPYFTITRESLWALDILIEEGIRYDSSIHPVFNDRYGIPSADRTASWIPLGNGGRILEVPVSTYPVPGLNLPAGGGAYFRIYPYWLQRRLLRRLDVRGETLGIYLHPWEIDPDHPRINVPLRISATHYWNLESTFPKLERLLSDFRFAPYRDVYADELRDA